MQYAKSLAELVLMTWFVTALGLATAAGFDVMDLGAWKTAAVAAFPAALAALYGAVVKPLGDKSLAVAVAPQAGAHRREG